ncbi:uncharacterized protein K02A2.6-like [Aedes albopictus]|uniref:DUF7083 domain-containing protein n=1 Tax=Aedes albopictus TaxID=7160 RepID=A0ABM1XV75_AEDAL
MAAPGGASETLMQQIVRQNQQMAEQNARLVVLLERFGFQEGSGSGRSSSNPESIIESLASNIHEFSYDPDNGQVYYRWYRKYEDLFLKDGAKLNDAAKVCLLLRSFSVNVFDRHVNFVLPKHPREFTFEETVKKLKELFSVQILLFSKRCQCFQLAKNDADDYVTYAGKVNKTCEDFELNKITSDQFKSLVFICGLHSTKDADIRTRLLSKLETNVDEDCKLESLITECQRLQNLKHDTAMVEHTSISSVCAVKQKKTQSNPSGPKTKPSSGKSSTAKTPCWQCGGMHFVRDCSFSNHVCKDCKQTKHMLVVSPGGRRKFLTVKIDGSEVTLQFDMAWDITIISQKICNKCLGSPQLLSTSRAATTASGKPLQLLGELHSAITLGGVTKPGKLYVASNNLNLFGLEWIDLFRLWDKPLSAICNQVHADQPNQGLGHCTKTKVRLFLKPEAMPVYKPKRPVPFTSVEKVDAELDRQQLGIIIPVEISSLRSFFGAVNF